MIIRIFLFCFLHFCCAGYAQNISIKEIKLKADSKYYKSKEPTIIYPIIVSKNKTVECLINQQVKEQLFSEEDTGTSIKKILSDNIHDYGLIDFSYEVTYNRNNILSLKIFREGCGAYCSSGYTCLNFDQLTGAQITIEDLIIADSLEAFRKIVFDQKLKALESYKKDELYIDTSRNIDSLAYNWALEQIENCSQQVSIDNFYLMTDKLEILDECGFPHIIQALMPSYHLFCSYQSFSPYIKPTFRKLLVP